MKYFVLFIFLISCGPSKPEKLALIIDEANYYLSSMDCYNAKKVLDKVSYQPNNADYVSLYSAYYACLAGYTVLGTVFDNLVNIQATSAGLFRSLADFSSSNETVADSAVYTNLSLAINEILINEDSTLNRLAKFKKVKGTDLSIQLLYMVLTQIGKYIAYYGNKGAAGEKGAGAGSNGCMMNYDNAAVVAILAANGLDSCSLIGDGPAEIDPADTDFVRRACEGIVLYNVFGDIISNVDFSTNPNLGALASTAAIYTSAVALVALTEPDFANYQDFKTLSSCQAYASTDLDELQRVFAAYVENLYL